MLVDTACFTNLVEALAQIRKYSGFNGPVNTHIWAKVRYKELFEILPDEVGISLVESIWKDVNMAPLWSAIGEGTHFTQKELAKTRNDIELLKVWLSTLPDTSGYYYAVFSVDGTENTKESFVAYYSAVYKCWYNRHRDSLKDKNRINVGMLRYLNPDLLPEDCVVRDL